MIDALNFKRIENLPLYENILVLNSTKILSSVGQVT